MVILSTFLANLKKAARDNTPVYIGGGDFTPEELKIVIADVERLQVQINALKQENQPCKP